MRETDHYVIAIDPRIAMLRIVTIGRWDAGVAAAFGDALSEGVMALAKAGVAIGTFRTLVDVRRGEIFPQHLIDVIRGSAAKHGRLSLRLAFLSTTTIQKLQFRRILPDRQFGHFTDEAEAFAWLASGD